MKNISGFNIAKIKKIIEKHSVVVASVLTLFLIAALILSMSTINTSKNYLAQREELNDQVNIKTDEVRRLEKELTEANSENSKKAEEIKLLSGEAVQKELSDNITKLESELEDKKVETDKLKKGLESEVTDLKDEVASLNDNIDKLKADVVQITGAPKKFPAGVFYQYPDFEAKRYKIHGGSSNFVVRSVGGALKVNIILGSHGLDEYIYDFIAGDVIDARSPFIMTPIN